MEQLNILATKLRNCITNFFTQAEAVGVKGNIYLFLEGEELSFSISELQGTSDFEKPLKEKNWADTMIRLESLYLRGGQAKVTTCLPISFPTYVLI
ncbi:hypothetical protein NXW16_01835 [Bacteroides thetaiotaomicron]|nr:hypothetical protein [Bacteroides thetaiotaomicron]